MARIVVNQDLCKACEYCIHFCPKAVFKLGHVPNKLGYNSVIVVADEQCIACKQCAVMCPEGAISVFK